MAALFLGRAANVLSKTCADRNEKIVLGTTETGFFSLRRLGHFLAQSPLGLQVALNLDGGPLASHVVTAPGFERVVLGQAEITDGGDMLRLLFQRLRAHAWKLPIVLAATPRVSGAATAGVATKVHDSPKAGFTFRYPDTWKVLSERRYRTPGGYVAKEPTVVLARDGKPIVRLNERQPQCEPPCRCGETPDLRAWVQTCSTSADDLAGFDAIMKTLRFRVPHRAR